MSLKQIPIKILDNSGAEKSLERNSQIIGLELNLFEKQLNFKIAASGNARLADIVPIARTICDKIANSVTEQLRNQKETIPCHKGCPGCCSYLVSLSVPEVLCFENDSFLKDKLQKQQNLKKYLLAAKKILEHQLPDQNSLNTPAELNALSDWFSGLNLTCPFLFNSQCTIYQQRPIVCREHFIAGSTQNCSSGQARIIEMPVQMGPVLCKLSKQLCGIDDAVMLPLALAWCEANKELSQRFWPAKEITSLFVEIVKESVCAPSYC